MIPENDRRERLDRRRVPHTANDLYQRIGEKLVQIDAERRTGARREQDRFDLSVAGRESKESTECV